MLESHRQEIAKLEALYASNPGGRVFVHLAEALRKGGEHERARNILHEGLARHPDSASGFVVLGRLLTDMGETGEAESAFRQVLDLDGGNLVALRYLGDLARTSGRRDDAIRLYRELIARNPSSDDVAFQLRALELEHTAAAEATTPEETTTDETTTQETTGPRESAASGAPGRMEPTTRAEPEFGIIELSALPGELGAFAGLAQARSVPSEEAAEPETRALDDDVVAMIERSAAPLELQELDRELAAAPVEVNLLAAAPELETPERAALAEEPAPETAAEDGHDMASAASQSATPEWAAPVEPGGAAGHAEAEATPAPVSELAAPDEPETAALADTAPDIELPIEPAYTEVVADEYADAIDISDLAGDTGEVVADAAVDLAHLEPTAEFAVADEAVSESVDAVVEYEEESALFPPVVFDEPWPTEPAATDPAGAGYFPDEAEQASMGPEAAEPRASEFAEPPEVLAFTESEQAAAEREDEVEPRLEPLWAADAPTDLEALLAGAADVTDEPYGFEIGEPDALQVSEELRYWTTEAESIEAEPADWLPTAVPDEEDSAAPVMFDGTEQPAPETDSGDVVTETLADLYLSQGFAERAADVYRALLRQRPGDERLTAKLAQAETSRATAAEEAGEVWLRGVESAWTGGAGAAGGETTPYTWTEREEREEGVAIGAYLRELITWGEKLRSLDEPEPPQDATEAAEPESEPYAEEMAWETHYAAEAMAVEPEPWNMTPEPEAAELESAAVEMSPEPDPWSMTAEPLLDESWGEAAPEPWAAIPETPADPWLAAEPAGIEAAPPASAPAARESSGNPVEDAFNEWFDHPGLPAAGAVAQDPAAATAAGPLATGDEPESNEDEDEDLEMFRAWLQSLKK